MGAMIFAVPTLWRKFIEVSTVDDNQFTGLVDKDGLSYFTSEKYNVLNSIPSVFSTSMRSISFSFLLVILLGITLSVQAFRAFLEHIRNYTMQRRFRQKNRVSHPIDTMEDGDVSEEESTISTSPSLREASRVLLQELWGDFSLFNFSSDEPLDSDNSEDLRDPQADVVHFCFLVHGLRGFSKDLSYLQDVMRQSVADRKQAQQVSNNTDNEPRKTRQDLLIHAAVCNERRTDDGVEAGGERLTEELREVILKEMALRESMTDATDKDLPVITISFLGNSLGGLYSRYAIAKLFESCERDPSGHLLLDGKYRLYLNIFLTTATPHLGIAGHTFIRIPRTAEVGVAHAMGQTGRDVFRVNSLILEMATQQHFVEPMRLFRQRIAYANAYGTDFPVPVHTAAFLNDESDYPHHFMSNKLQGIMAEEHSHLCIATMYTPQKKQEEDSTDNQDDVEDDLVLMSRSLDALGWKKVFVDPRRIVPKLSNPLPRLSRVTSLRLSLTNNSTNSSSATGSATTSDGESGTTASDSDTDDDLSESHLSSSEREAVAIDTLIARGVAPSRDVFHAVTAPPESNEKFHWPLGHNMIVAMSRNSIYTYLNKSGRPIVDALAAELVADIFEFSEKEPSSSTQKQ